MKAKLYTFLILVFVLNMSLRAQSLSGTVKKVITGSYGLVGTWDYKGSSIQFKTDNLLKKAGGKAVSSSLQKSIDNELSKIGIEAGITTFTFESNGKFYHTTKGKKFRGTYTYDSSSGQLTLKYLNHIPLKTTVSESLGGSKISLLFEVNEFLSMIDIIGNLTGVSVVKAVSSIISSYDGLMIGLVLQKQ